MKNIYREKIATTTTHIQTPSFAKIRPVRMMLIPYKRPVKSRLSNRGRLTGKSRKNLTNVGGAKTEARTNETISIACCQATVD